MISIDSLTGRIGNRMFQYAYLYSQVKEGKLPDVYVQDPKYFDHHREDIKKIYGHGIGSVPFTSVHIRRGDYVGNLFYVDLTDTDYYQKAFALFPKEHFLVFSDDPIWASWFIQDNFKEDFARFQLVENESDVEDMNLMASCESNIIANSSFSWWAGYLNPNPNKVVVCPAETSWHTDGIIRTRVQSEWTQIKV